jgi:hypothetical protein
MGQAKNRKAEILALKAAGSKKITPFIIRGSIQNGLVVYDTTSLDASQAAFVDGCVKTINENMIPEMDTIPTEQDHLTMVSWLNEDDFMGGLLGPFNSGNTPDSVWASAQMTFDKSQSKYPKFGFTYTRDEIVKLGTEHAGIMFDMLKEGGRWPWPNAHAVFEKHGDVLVVVDTI